MSRLGYAEPNYRQNAVHTKSTDNRRMDVKSTSHSHRRCGDSCACISSFYPILCCWCLEQRFHAWQNEAYRLSFNHRICDKYVSEKRVNHNQTNNKAFGRFDTCPRFPKAFVVLTCSQSCHIQSFTVLRLEETMALRHGYS